MTNESKTLFIPLYGKAIMSKEGFINDKTAEKIIESEKESFDNVDQSRKLAIYMAMRAEQYDEIVRNFIKENSDPVIIQLGCGLDSRINRVNLNPLMWYDLDFPDVIELRKKYYSENDFYTMIPSSVTNYSWLDKITCNSDNVLIVAEGLSMYLSETDMKNLIEKFRNKFRKSTFIFDAYSHFASKMSKYKNPINNVDAKIDFAMDDPAILENTNVKCVLNNDIIKPEYVNKLRGIDKIRFKFMGGAGRNMYRIFGYEITQ